MDDEENDGQKMEGGVFELEDVVEASWYFSREKVANPWSVPHECQNSWTNKPTNFGQRTSESWATSKGKSKKVWIDGFIEAISSARKIEKWNINFEELKEFLYKWSPESYAEAVSLVYVFYATRTIGKSVSRWGDKNNFYVDHIDEINKLFKSCKISHVLRDGRDVASSYKKISKKEISSKYAPKIPKKIHKIAEEWLGNIKLINSSLEKIEYDRVYELYMN